MAVKKTVSMPEILFDKSVDKMRQRGFSAYSDYIQDLIRRDIIPQQQPAQMAA